MVSDVGYQVTLILVVLNIQHMRWNSSRSQSNGKGNARLMVRGGHVCNSTFIKKYPQFLIKVLIHSCIHSRPFILPNLAYNSLLHIFKIGGHLTLTSSLLTATHFSTLSCS